MCDTFVYIPERKECHVIFGKNSDREPNEAQQIVRFPRNIREKSKVKTTFIEVDHPQETFEIILSKPFQMWGAEMGVNEFGVTIGNEAVFTKIPFKKKNDGLTGMDMIRLCLEISKTAHEALHHLIEYVEKYGQDTCGGYTDKNFYYHNSFIVADKNEAYVFETAGVHWVYEKVQGYRAISNGLSIKEDFDGISENAIDFAAKKGWINKNENFNFRKAYGAWLMPKLAACDARRKWSEDMGGLKVIDMKDAFSILRTHADDKFSPSNGKTNSICMHAAGLFTPHQTVGSMVAELRKDKPDTIWLTGTSSPCMSLFKPFYTGDSVLNEERFIAPSSFYDHSYWWKWERLNRQIIKDYSAYIEEIRENQNLLENSWIKEDKELEENWNALSSKVHSRGALIQSEIFRDELLGKIKSIQNKNGFLYNQFWNRQNKKVNLTT